MTRVLAIGATGFIGRYVLSELTERCHEVAVVHRGETPSLLPSGVRRVPGDRNTLFELRPEFERFAPDVVLDMIAYTAQHARDLARTCRGLARRIVVLSSADVYRNYDGFRRMRSAPPDPGPLTEEAPLRAHLYPYRGHDIPFAYRDDYERILVERTVVEQADLPVTVLRLPAVYGPGDGQHRLRPYVRRMDDGRASILLSHGQAGWRWTRGFVGNVARAIALAVSDSRASGRTYNVGEQPTLTEREWIHLIGSVVGWGGRVVTVDEEQLPVHLRQPFDWYYDLATDSSRIREELGYREPVPVRTAIAQTVAWERSHLESERPDYAAEDAAVAGAGGVGDVVS